MSKEDAYTSGDWQVYDDGICPVITNGPNGLGDLIATLPQWQPQFKIERDANANLISAAPDLLKALQAATKFLEGMRFERKSDDICAIELERTSLAVIAKATGKDAS